MEQEVKPAQAIKLSLKETIIKSDSSDTIEELNLIMTDKSEEINSKLINIFLR